MLGRRISHLRQRIGLTVSELAAAAGISEAELALIEEQNVPALPVPQLIAIADGLKLNQANLFARLLQTNGQKRRIHVIVVGLPKTGTVSMTGIFSRFQTVHEFLQWETHQTVIRYRRGEISRYEFRDFLRERDDLGMMEVDSAHFNRHYVDITAEEYPEARFICLIRDPFSWVSSLINYFVVPEREAVQSGLLPNGMPFDVPRGDLDAKDRLVTEFPAYAEVPIRFWAEEYRKMLALLPADRALILRTHQISGSLESIRRFVGVEAGDLCGEKSCLNKAHYTTDVLKQFSTGHLDKLFQQHCPDLLERFFPGYSLSDYLHGMEPAGDKSC